MLKHRFPMGELQQHLNTEPPCWSSYTCFAETIRGRNELHPSTIRKYFNKYVDKSDYAKSEKNQILRFLYRLAKGTED